MRALRQLLISIFISLILSPCLCAEEVGEWSEVVHGVQGRLIVKEDKVYAGTKLIAVYMELRNATNILGTIDAYYDCNTLKTVVVDSKGDVVSKPETADMSVFEPLPMWVVLPYDSSLRFRVSVSGYGI